MTAIDIPAALQDARERTLACVSDLSDGQLLLPMIDTLNPMLWEIGHVAYFAEFWTLRHLYGRDPIVANADKLYDSANIAHDSRWSLPLPDRAGTLAFLDRQLAEVLARYPKTDAPAAVAYLHQLALHHEDMHAEAMIYTRDSLAYPIPALTPRLKPLVQPLHGDATIPGGTYRIGAKPSDGFVWDNEKWEHEVELASFSISRTAVTNEDFAAFVEANGYNEQRYWDDEGWAWLQSARAQHPLNWRKNGGTWERRHFDQWHSIVAREPVIHVNAFEAQAFCNFAGRRLPTEAEWEVAATGARAEHANLDGWYGDVVSVDAFPDGESRFGVRGMLGNVWEWCADEWHDTHEGAALDGSARDSGGSAAGRVIRGGSWGNVARDVRAACRVENDPYRAERQAWDAR